MTLIENDSPKVQYTGPFIRGQLLPLTFPYIAKTDVKMLIDGVPAQLNLDFEIITEVSAEHPVAYPDSAYIKNALPDAKQITLYRVTPLDQQAPFPQNSKFRSERIEQALDKLTMQQQEQEEQLSRCIIAPITLETFNGQLPAPAADQALKWNTEGTALENYDIIGEQEAFETDINTRFEEQSTAIENRINQFEEETNTQFSEFRNEINENLEAVLNAADKLDTLDQQVQVATNAANTALTSATKADESAEEAENALEEIKQVIQDAEDTISTVTDALNSKVDLDGGNYAGSGLEAIVKQNSGGLEIGDIGIAPLGIDETKGKRRYLNGQVIIQDQYAQFTNKVKSAVALYPSLACTESEWQTTATMTVGGQVGKFVVDDETGTIRLPKIIMPIQGLTDLSKLGEIVEAGLPTHTHTRGTMDITGWTGGEGICAWSSGGAFTNADNGALGSGHTGNASSQNINFQASRNWTGSTSTGNYSKALATTDTVQQEQIQYPYFIQVATGAETEDNIINEIELNNPYSLLDVKWSDKLLNNISWLRSEGQANSKAIYNDVYDLILREYNSGTDETETVGGVSITFRRGVDTNIKVTTDKSAYDSILSTTGTAWYYVIDTANEMFYLPQSDGFFQFGGEGEFVEAGLPNITGTFGLRTSLGTSDMDSRQSGAFSRESLGGGSAIQTSGSDFGGKIIFDASDSNPIYGNSNTVQPNAVKGYLYFYVGETVQNANLINAGRIEEKIASLVTITESYVNGTSWYRVWSDGWKEQGGVASFPQYYNTYLVLVTFLKPFSNTNYTSIAQMRDGGAYWANATINVEQTATQLRIVEYDDTGNLTINAHKVNWYACGY